MTNGAAGAAAGGAGGPFGAWKTVDLPGGAARVAGLRELAAATGRDLARLPYSIRVLLENGLRFCGQGVVEEKDVLALLDWDPTSAERPEFAFMPARVLLQDFTGVPCVVDLAAMRSAMARAGGDPSVIDAGVPVDLVIDHSVQVDYRRAFPTPATSTWTSRCSATASATRCCVGPRASSPTCGWSRRERASATR